MRGDFISTEEWLLCPFCQSKTRTMVREETILQNFPLFCPKCKQQVLVNVQKLNMSVIKEPDVVIVLGATPLIDNLVFKITNNR